MKNTFRLPKQHFTLGDISAHHPEPAIFETDRRYTKFANDLYRFLTTQVFAPELKKGTIDLIVIRLTMYIEDIVSNLGIWETFVTLNQEMFGRRLPFFECDDDYVINKPNMQDIKYLIWSSAIELDKDAFFNPCGRWIKHIAKIVYSFLDLEFDKMPVNVQFFNFLYNPKNYDDLILLRGFLIWLFKGCYLTKGINTDYILNFNVKSLLDLKDFADEEKILYDVKAQSAFQWKTGPFAIYPKDFLAKMLQLKGLDKYVKPLKEILYYPKQIFKIEEVNKDGVFIISSKREKMFIPSDSFGQYDEKNFKISEGLFTSLVKYDGRIEINGICVFCPLNEKFKFDQPVRQESKGKSYMFNKFMEQSCNTGLLFFKDLNEVAEFGLPVEKKVKGVKNIVAFLEENSKLIFTFSNIAPMIKCPNNPFYNQKVALADAQSVIANKNGYIAPLLLHLIKNNYIPDAKFVDSFCFQDGIKLFQENIEFIARFFQQECWLSYSELKIPRC